MPSHLQPLLHRHTGILVTITVSILLISIFYTHNLIALNSPTHVDEILIPVILKSNSRSWVSHQLENHDNALMKISSGNLKKKVLETTYEITKLHTCFDGNRNVTIPQVPSFIIVGAQKSGTSSMFNYLIRHPNVVSTKNYVKTNGTNTEMHFFDWHYIKRAGHREMRFWKENNITSKDQFLCLMRQKYASFWDLDELFASANGTLDLRVTFEKTPLYLFLPYVPALIKETCPWLNKLIVILRNPVDRAYSHYWYEFGTKFASRGIQIEPFEERINRELEYMRNKGLTLTPNLTAHHIDNFDKAAKLPPSKCTRACEDEWFQKNYGGNVPRYTNLLRGMYGMQLREWLKHYSAPENLLVINYDDLHSDTRGVYERILRHVGLPQHHLASLEKSLHLSRIYQPMSQGTRRFLEIFYQPYNEQLADLLGEEWRGVWTS